MSFFVLGELLHQSLQQEDDGSALFLLFAGEELLYILEEPIRSQICLRNIFEAAHRPVRLLLGLVYSED